MDQPTNIITVVIIFLKIVQVNIRVVYLKLSNKQLLKDPYLLTNHDIFQCHIRPIKQVP
jgi:hypothetical protein